MGYNDCPESLFVLDTQRTRRVRPRRIPVGTTNVDAKTDTPDDSEKLNLPKSRVASAAVVPPPIGRRSASRSASRSSSSSLLTANETSTRSSSLRSVDDFSEEELLKKVGTVIETESRLSVKELDYYRKKVDTNMEPSLKSPTVKLLLSHFFTELESGKNKEEAQKLLIRAITSDTTISSWCPAFLKIFENANI